MSIKLSKAEYLEQLLSLPEIYIFKRSPDNKFIGMNIVNFHTNWDVFIITHAGSREIKSLTDNDELTQLVEWWPDSKSVLVSQDKDRNERVTIYRVFVDDPNKLQPLTEIEPDYYLRSTQIDPKGQYLYYFANYDFKQNKETETFRLFKQKILESSESIPQPELLITPEKPAYHSVSLNKKGNKLLYNRSDIKPGGKQFYICNTDGSEDTEILNFGDEAKVQATWHPDSVTVPFITDSLDGKRLKKRLLGLYNTESTDITWITKPDHDNRIDFGSILAPKYTSEYLIGFETKKSRSRAYFYHLKNEIFQKISVQRGSLLPFQRLANENWLALLYSSTQPTTLVSFPSRDTYNLELSDLTYYFDNFEYTSITRKDLIPAQEMQWTSVDDKNIHGWYYPAQKPSHKSIIYVHGGPTSHVTDAIYTEIQFYTNQGFNVLTPNYRGSTGYGIDFKESIKEDGWGGREQDDIAKAAQKLIATGKVNRNKKKLPRIGITGTSYGGYSTWFAITKFPDLFAAGAPVCGMTDLFVDYKTTRPDLRPYSAEMMGGTPEEVPDKYRQASPIHFIKNITGEVLIVQGDRDPNVTPENVKTVETKLKEHNIRYEKLTFKDEGHGIVKRKNKITKIIRISDFFDEALKQ